MQPSTARRRTIDGGSGRRGRSVNATARNATRSWARALALGVFGLVGVVAVWQLSLLAGLLPELSVPPPAKVFGRIGDLLADAVFYEQLADTLLAWLTSLTISIAIVVPVGIVCGSVKWLYRPVSAVIHAARSVPATAMIPIAILFFGLGSEMKVAVTCYAISWPLVLNTLYGVRAVDPVMVNVARTLRWTKTQVLFRLVLPSAAPYVVTGIRLASAIGLVVVISTELLGASSGIGNLVGLYQQSTPPQSDFVYAGIVLIGILGLLAYYVLSALERKFLPWAPASRR